MERLKSTRICALIPTYNNAGTILDVVRRVHQQMRDIIVVDDGCTDDTLALLSTLDFTVTVVSHPRNKGKGAALATGFRKAIQMGFDHALTIDADGQHYPEDIPLMLSALDVHPNALIVGSRQFTDENMSGKSKFANRFSNFWFRLQTTINLPDTQTGMRIYPLHRLYGLNLLTGRYEAELELLVFAAWRNVPLVPVPIRVYYPPKEQRVSHFRPAYDFTRISILNTFLCIGALLFGYINMYWRTVICFLYFGVVMLFFANPYSRLYFAIHGRTQAANARYRRFVQRMAQHFTRNILGLHLTVNEQQARFTDRQAVIIANHQSFIDIIICLALSANVVVVVKDYVWRNPLFRVVLKFLDSFPISMDDCRKEALLEQAVAQGYSVLIYPEGTRTESGEVGRFHRGAFYYAEKYNLPIQPLLIEGMVDYIGKQQFTIKPAHVQLTVLPLVPADDTSFGPNYKRRAKSFELYYRSLMHMRRPSVGILGAGVGGLFTGALLAKRGYQVTLLEQLPVFGGGLYSYERNGETWATGMHILAGLQPDGEVTKVLESLDIHPDCVPTTMDHSPEPLIGEKEWSLCQEGIHRFVAGSQRLANDLALYITRHGGRILLSQRVTAITKDGDNFQIFQSSNLQFSCDAVVSSLHPKQLLQLTELPICRPVTSRRIMSTPETFGSFKTYIRLLPDTLPYDPVTHFLPEHNLLVMTPCSEHNQVYARTIETVMPLSYDELAPWQANRKDHYADYEAYKRRKEQEVITLIETLYPDIRTHIADVFSSTSLTFRDDYLSPEGAMYGMSESIGAIRTRVPGFYLTGQNIFYHGLCGVVITAQYTVQALCDDCE